MTKKSAAVKTIRGIEKFTTLGWIEALPLHISKGSTFRFTDEPGIINLAVTDMSQDEPYGVQVDVYQLVETPAPGPLPMELG